MLVQIEDTILNTDDIIFIAPVKLDGDNGDDFSVKVQLRNQITLWLGRFETLENAARFVSRIYIAIVEFRRNG